MYLGTQLHSSESLGPKTLPMEFNGVLKFTGKKRKECGASEKKGNSQMGGDKGNEQGEPQTKTINQRGGTIPINCFCLL